MPEDSALVDVEYPSVGGVGGRVLDLLADASFGAKLLEGEFPGDVGLEVMWFATGPEDEMFVFGAFLDNCSNFVFGEDFFLLELSQLGHCAFEVEAGLLSDVGHGVELQQQGPYMACVVCGCEVRIGGG